jgi:HD-GYP domain-containing protein (c-di-GMP phosphodiesterase class II)
MHTAGARASAAAALLRDRFEVLRWSPEALWGTPSVLLVDGDDPGDRALCDGLVPATLVRVIALVNPDAPGPWPEAWYAVLPAGVSAAILAATVSNAVADLGVADELARLNGQLADLNTIGIGLSAERDPDVLLDLILRKAREITQSDAGSLYLVEDREGPEPQLRFALVQNDSIEVPFRSTTVPLTSASVAGHAALSGEVVNLPDAYAPPPGSPFSINRWFDEAVGYRSKSMLVVPMRTPTGDTLGVLQLINCKRDFATRLVTPEMVKVHVVPFSPRHERLARSLASQAAVALDNSRLYQSVRDLFEGFVQASVTAIEARDPTTSGHSARVAELTLGLAEAVDRCEAGACATVHFSVDEIKELRYASLLHDFGKVGVREQVLVKAKKLYPGELERIRQRVELIKRGVELHYAHRKVEHLLAAGRRRWAEQAARFDRELAAWLDELDASMARIVAFNEPSVLPYDVAAQLEALARPSFPDHHGARLAVLTADDARILAIARGSLTPEELREVQSHVVHTFQFLSRIPWTRELRRIPEIARSHHEKLDGSGYPNGLGADSIPVQARMMAIADIYDALTAADRPYKKAVPTDQALDILAAEQRAGRLDGALLSLFLEAKVYERSR